MRHNEKGVVLITALWIMIFLSAVSVILAQRVHSQLSVIGRFRDQSQSRVAAITGVTYATFFFTQADEKGGEGVKYGASNVIDLHNAWHDHPGYFKDLPLSKDYRVSVGYRAGPELFVHGFIDEQSKININQVGLEVFVALYRKAGLSEDQAVDLARATLQYRSRQEEFEEFGHRLPSTGAGFGSPEELALVPGMPDKVIEALRYHLTVFGKGTVNLNTVSKSTLVALGLSESVGQRLEEYRQEYLAELGERKEANQKMFSTVSDFFVKLSLSSEESLPAQALGELWGVESEAFRFQSVALPVGRLRTFEAGIECVADKKGNILYYKEI